MRFLFLPGVRRKGGSKQVCFLFLCDMCLTQQGVTTYVSEASGDPIIPIFFFFIFFTFFSRKLSRLHFGGFSQFQAVKQRI